MPVTILCPNLTCRSVLQVPDKARGKKVRCGRCGLTFSVPAQPGGKIEAPKELSADHPSKA